MKIALNALSAKWGGGVSVFETLLPYLAQLDTTNTYYIFYSSSQENFTKKIPKKIHKIVIRFIPKNPFLRVFWEQCIFPFYLLRYGIQTLYSVGNITTLFAPCKIVLLIENANPYSLLHLPLSPGEYFRNYFLFILGLLSAYRATRIRFVSENSKYLILSHYNISPLKCTVIPHGISQFSHFQKTIPPHRPYILTIGVNAPHRNTERLLKAFAILIQKYQYNGDLLILGHTGFPSYHTSLLEYTKKLGLDGRVLFKGEIPHEKIKQYFKHADMLTVPSLEETFGIPLIEAMSFGIPIAASDCDLNPVYRGKCFNPFREICNDAAYYFDPFNVENMAFTIHNILISRNERQRLIMNGKIRVKHFDLKDITLNLIQLLTKS